MPRITGLWQVEARDNPSFEAYRRLDLFVENWSVTFDLVIVLRTAEQLVTRLATLALSRGPVEESAGTSIAHVDEPVAFAGRAHP